MYKVGDKILCKKDRKYINLNSRNFSLSYLKNYEYTISAIHGDVFGGNTKYVMRIGNQYGSHWLLEYEITMIFYTKQEIRKLKLEKLKDV